MDGYQIKPCSGKRKIDDNSGDSLKKMVIDEKHSILQSCSNKSEKIDFGEKSLILEPCSSKKLFLPCRLDEGDLVWYRIDAPDTITDEINCISDVVCRIPPSVISRNGGIASLGSKIYMVGGDHSLGPGSTDDVLFFDTATAGDHFVFQKDETCHMLVKRSNPTAVSTHGKIYVFGSHVPSHVCWGEVFDPETSCWSPLPEPPPGGRKSTFTPQLSGVIGDTILLFFRDNLFSFDVKTNRWESLTATHPLLMQQVCNRGFALDQNILLSFYVSSVRAYDFSAQKWLKVKGLGMKHSNFRPWEELCIGYVVRLGENTFCAVWSDVGDEAGRCDCYVRSVKFRVARVNNSKGMIKFFQGQVLGRSAYRLPSCENFLFGCFPM